MLRTGRKLSCAQTVRPYVLKRGDKTLGQKATKLAAPFRLTLSNHI